MARKNKSDGFSFEDIVSTDFSNKNSDVHNDIKTDIDTNVNIIEKLKNNEEAKVKTLLYIDGDIANHLDYYGELIGKKNGGKSKFCNESLKLFLIENNLWDEKIASKRRKTK